jgi:hypothetical protein
MVEVDLLLGDNAVSLVFSDCCDREAGSGNTEGMMADDMNIGGQGWTGPTTCAVGTCTFSNTWYSQCIP